MAKKKIIFVVNNFARGGTELFLHDLINELKNFYEIKVVTLLGGGPLEPDFLGTGAALYKLNKFMPAVKPGFLYKLLWFGTLPITLIRLVVLLYKVKPNLVVTSLYQADILGIFAAYVAGVPKRISIQHDIAKAGISRKTLKFLVLKLANTIVAVSSDVESFLRKYYKMPARKISILPNGINIEKFYVNSSANTHGKVILGILGRLEKIKGIDVLLEALRLMQDENIVQKVVVAGTGSQEYNLKRYAESHLLSQVEFLGEISDRTDFLCMVDILVAPSREEGFGLSVLEGLAAGKMVIVSNLPAFQEFKNHGAPIILFQNGSAHDLARILKEVILNPAMIKKYQVEAYEWWKNGGIKYQIKNVAKEYLNLFYSES